jgi:hypothetical protein
LGRRLDLEGCGVPRILAAAAGQAADCANLHVMIAQDLTAQPNAAPLAAGGLAATE